MSGRIYNVKKKNGGQYSVVSLTWTDTRQEFFDLRRNLVHDPDHLMSIPRELYKSRAWNRRGMSLAAATLATGSPVLFITRVGTPIVGSMARMSMCEFISSRATSAEGLAPARTNRISHSRMAGSVSFG